LSNVKGTTESGFKFEIDPGVLTSWEAMEYLVKIEQGDVAAASEGFRFIIGSDQLDKVLEFVRKKNGTPYASQEDVLAVANEIVKAAQDAQGEENAKN
jgi:hypothetical protein